MFLARDELDGSALSWPYGYSARANPLAVYDDSDNRVAVVGDRVTMAGGLMADSVHSITGCLGFTEFWGVGQVVAVVARHGAERDARSISCDDDSAQKRADHGGRGVACAVPCRRKHRLAGISVPGAEHRAVRQPQRGRSGIAAANRSYGEHAVEPLGAGIEVVSHVARNEVDEPSVARLTGGADKRRDGAEREERRRQATKVT